MTVVLPLGMSSVIESTM